MDLSDILLIALIAIAVAPVLLVALLGGAIWFDLPIADRILDVTVRLLTIQWIVGGLLNIGIGIALVGLGGWLGWHGALPWYRLAALVPVAFGVWRTYRGVTVLRGMRNRP